MTIRGTQRATLVDQYNRPLHGLEAQPVRRSVTRLVISGAPMYAGQFAWDDPHELRLPERRAEIYRLMEQTDPNLAEGIRSTVLPLLARAVFDLQPGVKSKSNPALMKPRTEAPATLQTSAFPPKKLATAPTPRPALSAKEKLAQEVRDLVNASLYGEESEAYGREFFGPPWRKRRREICKKASYGFALFHRTWKVVNGKHVYASHTWLEPQTLVRWLWDDANGEFVGVERRYLTPSGRMRNETLPVAELGLHVMDFVGLRVEGTSSMRCSFGNFRRKELLLRYMILAAQRGGVGMPWAKWNPDRLDAAAGETIEEALQSSLGSGLETAYMAVPDHDFDAGYMQEDAQQFDKFGTMIGTENLGIAHGMGTKSGMLAEGGSTTGSGSRALAEPLNVDKYLIAEALAQDICDEERDGCLNFKGPIAALAERNYPDPGPLPSLKASGIDPNESTRHLPLLFDGLKCNAVRQRPAIEKIVLESLGEEWDDEAYLQEPDPPPAPPAPGPDNPAKPAAKLSRRLSLRTSIEELLRRPGKTGEPSGYGRGPTAFEEKVLAVSMITSTLDRGQEHVGAVLRRAHREMIADLVARAEAGKITRDTLGALRKSNPRDQVGMRSAVRVEFVAIASQGRQHVVEELERQRSRKLEVIPPGGNIPKGPGSVQIEPLQVLLDDLAEEARVTAEISIDGLWSRLVGEAVGEFNRLTREQVPDEELMRRLESFLQGLSERPVDDAARRVTNTAYTDGRDVALKLAASEGVARWAVRSALLDTATCANCGPIKDGGLDGTIVEIGSPEYDQLEPPAYCLGDENCRCIYVALDQGLVDQGEVQ